MYITTLMNETFTEHSLQGSLDDFFKLKKRKVARWHYNPALGAETQTGCSSTPQTSPGRCSATSTCQLAELASVR